MAPEYQYYDLRRNWNRKIKRFAEDPLLLKQLSYDFGKYTYGRWKRKYDPTKRPYDYEGEPLSMPGRKPPWLPYVKTMACHWLVNYGYMLISRAEPDIPWVIVISDEHSTVWDLGSTFFDINFYTFGVPAWECAEISILKDEWIRLPPGQLRPTAKALYWTKENLMR